MQETQNRKSKRYYWLKLPSAYFNQLEQKKMRRQENGKDMQIVYLRMMLLSVDKGGYIYYQGVYNTLEEELAEEFNESVDIITQTLKYLEENGMICISENSDCFIPETLEHTGSECCSAKRVRKTREGKRSALQCNTDVTACNTDVTACNTDVTACNTDVTACNTEIEIEKEKEKDAREELHLNSVCPEPDEPAPDPSGIRLVLNDKSCYDVTLSDIQLWSDTYPAVDVEGELKRMISWFDSNPTRRKTRRGIKRFINSWLSREQDRGRSRGKDAPKDDGDDSEKYVMPHYFLGEEFLDGPFK